MGPLHAQPDTRRVRCSSRVRVQSTPACDKLALFKTNSRSGGGGTAGGAPQCCSSASAPGPSENGHAKGVFTDARDTCNQCPLQVAGCLTNGCLPLFLRLSSSHIAPDMRLRTSNVLPYGIPVYRILYLQPQAPESQDSGHSDDCRSPETPLRWVASFVELEREAQEGSSALKPRQSLSA